MNNDLFTEDTDKLQPKMVGDHDYLNDLFQQWYAVYPRKTDPTKARKAFDKAIDKIKYTDLYNATVSFANKAKDKDSEFIKMPATWLNQECWLNETNATPQLGDTGPTSNTIEYDGFILDPNKQPTIYEPELVPWCRYFRGHEPVSEIAFQKYNEAKEGMK